MKKVLLSFALAALMLPLSAQVTTFPWTEDFEGGSIPATFTLIDNDGDGNNWIHMSGPVSNQNPNLYYGHESLSAITSWSYDGDALTPDNWFVTPAIVLPAGSEYSLSWYVRSFASATYANDNYSVYISTSNSISNMTTAVFNEFTPTEWSKRTIDLTNYAGQTIYIAFRHHNCTDMYFFSIDDLRIGDAEIPEVTVSGPASVRLGVAATYTATSSASPISWTVDGAAATAVNDTLTYTFNTTGTHTIIASVTNAAGTAYDTIETDVFDCPTQTLPYTAVFGDDDLGCWESRSDSTQGSGWFSAVSYGLGQIYSISSYDAYGIGWLFDIPVDNWAFSPMITMGNDNYEVAWKVKPYNTSYAGDHYSLYVISGTDTNAIFSETLDGNMTEYVDRIVALPAGITGDFQIAFRHHGSTGGNIILIDQIKVQALSAPVVTLAGPDSVGVDIPVTFTAMSTNATSFAWTVDGAAQSETGNTLTYTFTTAGSHTVSVTATNTIGTSAPVSHSVEVVSCDAVTSFPWVESFDGASAYCWNFISANTDDFDDWRLSGGYLYSPWNDSSNVNDYAISPAITLPANADGMVLNYEVYARGYQGLNIAYEVLVSTNGGTAIADFSTVLTSEQDLNMSGFESRSLSVSQFAGQTIRLAFHNISPVGSYDIRIDNVTIRTALNPVYTISSSATATQTGEVVNLSATYVEGDQTNMILTWSSTMAAAGQATITGANTANPTITYSAAGTDQITFTATNSYGTFTDNLTINVISCDPIAALPWSIDFSTETIGDCWLNLDADGDGFTWRTATFQSGETCLISESYSNNSGALNPDNWLITPKFATTAGAPLTFTWEFKAQDADYPAEKVGVYVSSTGSNPSDFTAIETFTCTADEAEWQTRSYNLDQYAGQTIRIAIRHFECTDQFYFDVKSMSLTTTTGIADVDNSAISLYPNPASNMVEVSAQGVEGRATVAIVDLNGRTLMQQEGNAASYRFDVSGLAAGAYFVRMTGENVNAVQKLIVK